MSSDAFPSLPPGGLDALADAELQALRGEIDALLARRQRARQADALSQIRRLARAHGLDIAASAPARKRGRPPKADGRI